MTNFMSHNRKEHGPKNCPTVTIRNNPFSEGTHVFLGDNLLLI